MKKRDMAPDFIRILATALIIFFHFFSSIEGAKSWTLTFKNGTWGLLGTSIFFMLSGYLLRLGYKDAFSLKNFYKKRWLSIFPAFYIAFAGSYLYMLITGSSPLYGGPAYKLLYTVFGIDKYVNWFGITNYSTVGEWFTAVIIVLYIMYPFLSRVLSGAKISFTVILFIVYLFMNLTDSFPGIADISVINALVMFWAGMVLADYGEPLRKNKLFAIPCGMIGVLILFVRLPIKTMFMGHLLALCIFLFMLILLPDRIPSKLVSKPVTFLAGLSYDIYLIHHFLLLVLSSLYKHFGIRADLWIQLVIYLILTIVLSYLLNVITKFVIGFKSMQCK